jgi:hypothetical protein
MMKHKNLACILKMKLIGFFLFQLCFTTISSQNALPLIEGDQIRFSSEILNYKSVKMTYHHQSDNTITFNDGKDYTVSISQIDKIHVKRGRKSNFLKGAGIGTFTGATIGLVIGLGDDYFGSSLAGVGAIAGAFLGFVSGSLVGLMSKTDNWKEVPINDLKIGVLPNGGSAVGLGLTLMF